MQKRPSTKLSDMAKEIPPTKEITTDRGTLSYSIDGDKVTVEGITAKEKRK